MKCRVCTFENAPESAACAACGHLMSATVTKRKCEICTLENDPSISSTCEACKAWWCDTCGTCNSSETSLCVACHDREDDERDKVDLSAASIVLDFDAAKLEKALRRAAKISPSLLDHIVQHPARFLAEACGQPLTKEQSEAAKTSTRESLDNVVEPIVAVEDDDGASSTPSCGFSSSDELSEDENESSRAEELFKHDGVRDEDDRGGMWRCGLCEAKHSTANILKTHMLLAHVRQRRRSSLH